jgi:8-oxo-dGTP diphosphatase
MRQSIVAAILNSNKDQILIIKRRDVPVWVLPGGALDQGETPEEGIIREVLEETGLKVSIKRKVAVYSPINKLGTLTHLFECSAIDGELQTGSETADIGFFPLDQLPSSFFYIHRDMIEDTVKNHAHSINKPLDQVTYRALFRYFLKHPVLLIRFALSQLGFPLNSSS